jgi:hypothetical protein
MKVNKSQIEMPWYNTSTSIWGGTSPQQTVAASNIQARARIHLEPSAQNLDNLLSATGRAIIDWHGQCTDPRSVGRLGVASANTSVGASPETFLQQLLQEATSLSWMF